MPDAPAIAIADGVPGEGARQIRECLFNKLLGIEYDGQSGQAIICVTNQQKPTTICVYPILSRQFKFCLDLALAHYRHEAADFLAKESSIWLSWMPASRFSA